MDEMDSKALEVERAELVAIAAEWRSWAREWSGTAFIADELLPVDSMTESEHKAELYSGLCSLGNHMDGLYDRLSVFASGLTSKLAALEGENKTLRELIRSFVLNEIDYMTRNNLGDPEKQHNVKWARTLDTAALSKPAALPAEGKGESEAVERLAEFLCSEFDFDLNPCTGYSWPQHPNDDGYRGGGYVKLQPPDVQARARENAKRILSFLRATPPAPQPLKGAVTDALVERASEVAREHLEIDGDGEGPFIRLDSIEAAVRAVLSLSPAPQPLEVSAMSYWRSIDTAPEDQHVILATSGGHVGEAIMLIDEDTGQQKWAWALGPLHPNHTPYGWQPLPSSLSAPVLSDLRDGGFDGPTGAE